MKVRKIEIFETDACNIVDDSEYGYFPYFKTREN